eukprot:UN06393
MGAIVSTTELEIVLYSPSGVQIAHDYISSVSQGMEGCSGIGINALELFADKFLFTLTPPKDPQQDWALCDRLSTTLRTTGQNVFPADTLIKN